MCYPTLHKHDTYARGFPLGNQSQAWAELSLMSAVKTLADEVAYGGHTTEQAEEENDWAVHGGWENHGCEDTNGAQRGENFLQQWTEVRKLIQCFLAPEDKHNTYKNSPLVLSEIMKEENSKEIKSKHKNSKQYRFA